MYGETALGRIGKVVIAGLSPHVRGNPTRHAETASRYGSIPACTGKPQGDAPIWLHPGVYPRMYGETDYLPRAATVNKGLSPHVRGNRRRRPPRARGRRSIPACTGKPQPPAALGAQLEVYPRMYGETVSRLLIGHSPSGLSPHVRGNLGRGAGGCRRHGSIPACTGKPDLVNRIVPSKEVYPRMYGETSKTDSAALKSSGLSPHVRGNR